MKNPNAPRPHPSGPRPLHPVYKPSRPPQGPLIFKKMIGPPADSVANGAFVELKDRQGRLLGRGFYNRKSELAFRLLARPDEPTTLAELLKLRLERADALRTQILNLPARTNAWRWIHAEADGLSGLIIDRYGEVVVVGLYSRGWVLAAELLEETLLAWPGIKAVHFVADDHIAKLEGFRPPEMRATQTISVQEDGATIPLDLSRGHKTGLFLDQRDNRARLAHLVRGARVLDLCCNAGGFALAAATRGGAQEVIGVDLDEGVLEIAEASAKRAKAKIRFVHADLFPWLRQQIAAGESFDVVVLDPPKLARGPGEVMEGLRTYLDMNRLAMQVVRKGGLLFTFSCSGAVSERDFQGMLLRAGRDSGRELRFLELVGAAPDHPIAFEYLEGRYLKGALLQVDGTRP